MTDLRPYFTQIIGHNSVNVHRIPIPMLVRRSALMSPLSVPNFSPIRARIRVLWRILRSVRNEVYIIPRNGTERNGIFRGIILRNGTPKVPRYIL